MQALVLNSPGGREPFGKNYSGIVSEGGDSFTAFYSGEHHEPLSGSHHWIW